MKSRDSGADCFLRDIDPVDLHWVFITVGLIVLCFLVR